MRFALWLQFYSQDLGIKLLILKPLGADTPLTLHNLVV